MGAGKKKADNTNALRVDKKNWAKTMENIVLHLKLVGGVRGALLAYAVWCHIKVVHVLPGYNTYLNLDEEMIVRASIVDGKSNHKLNQESLDKV